MLRALRITFVTILVFITVQGGIVIGDQSWQHDVEDMVSQFLSCQTPIDDQSPCNYFLGRSLKRVYGITDFDDGSGGFLSANAIATYVQLNTDKWTSLGPAKSQDALTQAAGYANQMKAIVAVQVGTPHGHVALVLPGDLKHSGNWNLDAPNSASFFLNKPQQSYVGKPLSFAFQMPDGVTIYGRNY